MIQGIRYFTSAQSDNTVPLITTSVSDQWNHIRDNGSLIDGTELCYAELIEGPFLVSSTNGVAYVLETVIFSRSTVGSQTFLSKIFSQPHTSIRLS